MSRRLRRALRLRGPEAQFTVRSVLSERNGHHAARAVVVLVWRECEMRDAATAGVVDFATPGAVLVTLKEKKV